MADRMMILKDNRQELERLETLVKGLKPEDFVRGLPNGWTVTVALAQLVFRDLGH